MSEDTPTRRIGLDTADTPAEGTPVRCLRCHAETGAKAEMCWYCHGALCPACWEAHGHCGHPEAAAQNPSGR